MCKSSQCPRCHGRLEIFSSHTYCASCNDGFCDVDMGHEYKIPDWAIEAIKLGKEKAKADRKKEQLKEVAINLNLTL